MADEDKASSDQALAASLRDAVEAPQPPMLAGEAADALLKKAELPLLSMLVLGVLAGVYIAFGGLFAMVALAGAEGAMPHGAAQVLAGLVFVLGLALVIIAGAELFTGNSLMVAPLARGAISAGQLGRSWLVVYTANLAGSLLIAVLALAAGAHLAGDGAVGRAALSVAAQKTAMPFMTAVYSGILANALVCLAVWMSYAGRSVTDKFIAILLPIAAFVAAGLEHSVANMYLVPFGLLVQAAGVTLPETAVAAADMPTLTVVNAIVNLAAATLGNVIGGGAIGLAYWVVYLRDDS